MTDSFTIEEEFIGPDRFLIGRNSSNHVIGIFPIDEIKRRAKLDPSEFLRTFNATVCNKPDTPDHDRKHPDLAPRRSTYLDAETAPFFVEAYRRAAKELGLPTDCEIPVSVLQTIRPMSLPFDPVADRIGPTTFDPLKSGRSHS